MRTLIIIAIGIVLAALLLALFRRDARTLRTVFVTFAIAWIAVCAWNMWQGVARAGYPYFATVGLSGQVPTVSYLNEIVPIDGD